MKIYPDVITSPMLQKQELKLTAKLEIARFIFHPICTLIKMHPSFSFILPLDALGPNDTAGTIHILKLFLILSPMLHRYNVKLCHIELLARAKLIALGHLLTKKSLLGNSLN